PLGGAAGHDLLADGATREHGEVLRLEHLDPDPGGLRSTPRTPQTVGDLSEVLPCRDHADAAAPERGEVLHGDLPAGDVVDAHRGAAFLRIALDQHHRGAAAADRLDDL